MGVGGGNVPTCKDCKNFKSKDDLEGYCSASEDEVVESERDSEDCIAGAFESGKNKDNLL